MRWCSYLLWCCLIAISSSKGTPWNDPNKSRVLYGCNFDMDLCTFKNSQTSDFDWERFEQGKTTVLPYMPSTDAKVKETYAPGGFMYASSRGTLNGHRAVLESDWISTDSFDITSPCIGFQYQSTAPMAATLEVFYQRFGNGDLIRVWKTRYQTKGWNNATAPVDMVDTLFKVFFVVTTNAGVKSVMSIDEVSVLSSSCDLIPYYAEPDAEDIDLNRIKMADSDAYSRHSCGIGGMNQLISGSATSPKGTWKWQAAIFHVQNNAATFLCSAVVAFDGWVVTAAHCLQDVISSADLLVSVGAWDISSLDPTNTVVPSAYYVHPWFNRGVPQSSDIAVLRIAPTAVTGADRLPCLPLKSTNFTPGKSCYTLGWGKTSVFGSHVNVLKHVNVRIADEERCKERSAYDSKNSLCVGDPYSKVGPCSGDSGGPLLCMVEGKWNLAGITSAGGLCSNNGPYSIYTRVSSYVDWLYHLMTLDGDGMHSD